MSAFIGAPAVALDNISLNTNASGQAQIKPLNLTSNTPAATSVTGSDQLLYEIALPAGIVNTSVIQLLATSNGASPARAIKYKVFDGTTETTVGATGNPLASTFTVFEMKLWTDSAGAVCNASESSGAVVFNAQSTASITLNTLTKLRIYANISSGTFTLDGYRCIITR
jgi:hypothetical protein